MDEKVKRLCENANTMGGSLVAPIIAPTVRPPTPSDTDAKSPAESKKGGKGRSSAALS